MIDKSNYLLPRDDILGICLQNLLSVEESDHFVRICALGSIATEEETDDFIMGGFLTETYAKKGWINRMMSYVTGGQYELGADTGFYIFYILLKFYCSSKFLYFIFYILYFIFYILYFLFSLKLLFIFSFKVMFWYKIANQEELLKKKSPLLFV